MDNESLGKLIRKYRKEKQMTQAELAQLVYVSTNAVSKWEMGKNSIDPQNLERLVDVLGIPQSVLLEEAPENPGTDGDPADTGTINQPIPELENNNGSPTDGKNFPSAYIDPTKKKAYKRTHRFLFTSIVGIGIVSILIICIIWLNHKNSFVVQEEYFDIYNGECAYYLIAEYEGKLTPEVISEYSNLIRQDYSKYFDEVQNIVVLFFSNYNQNNVPSIDMADGILVLLPDPFKICP